MDEMHARGINVCIGHDSIMDPWYPLGKGSMLQAANLLLHTAHMSGYEQIFALFDMITANSAKTLQVEDRYGIEAGKPANFAVWDAEDEFDAIRRESDCLYAVRRGVAALKTRPAVRSLDLGGFRRDVDLRVPVRGVEPRGGEVPDQRRR